MTQSIVQTAASIPHPQNATSLVFGRSLRPRRKEWTRFFRYFAGIWGLSILLAAPLALADKPEIDVSYADGQLYDMIGTHVIANPNPSLLAQSEELYIVAYPLNPQGATNLGTLTLPSGYQPNCDPCFHAGIPLQFAYHDHILTGAPGLGANGTAGKFLAPWKIIVLMYKPEVALRQDFKPVTSEAELDAAQAAGEFLRINPGADNPFELDTGVVLICPFVSPHA